MSTTHQVLSASAAPAQRPAQSVDLPVNLTLLLTAQRRRKLHRSSWTHR